MAVVRVFTPIDMFSDVVYGNVTARTSNLIEIRSGSLVVRYEGAFTYDAYGVYGQLRSMETFVDGRAQASAAGFTVDAYRFFNAVNSGDLGAGLALVLAGNDDIHGSGGRDALRGFRGSDTIRGDAGADRLVGGTGADELHAGRGADKLEGGRGADDLWGGTDAQGDDFVFLSRSDSGTGAKRDVIHNFTRGMDDIDLQRIDAQAGGGPNEAFTYGGQKAAAFSVWWKSVDAGVVVRADVNGDARADFEILVDGPLVRLGEGDFLL